MAKQPVRQPHSPAAADAEYRLVLDKGGLIPASGVLWSPLLDPVMHAVGASGVGVGIAFGDCSDETRDGKAVMDAFQIRSMIEYLTNQSAVRHAIEAALDQHRQEWKLAKLGAGADAWKSVKVVTLVLEALAKDHEPGREPLTVRSQFKVMLGPREPGNRAVRPWTDGHQRIAEFRNGQLVDLLAEG